jgi:UDP-N-acetylglucosamine/UDP-N-acetylgalactosamine diphosphorylase
VVTRDGRYRCVEYSNISAELQAERAVDGGLRFRAGNIAIHAFELDFAEEMAEAKLELHLARKRIPALPPGGLVAEPRDGIKFETFVFDALPLAERSVVQLADRALEFAPVKNRSGVDSIATSRQALAERSRRWLEQARIVLPATAADGPVELESGLCYGPEDLGKRREFVTHSCAGRLFKVQG